MSVISGSFGELSMIHATVPFRVLLEVMIDESRHNPGCDGINSSVMMIIF